MVVYIYLGVAEVVSPETADLVLAAHVPPGMKRDKKEEKREPGDSTADNHANAHGEVDVFVLNLLHVEANGGNGRQRLVCFQLIIPKEKKKKEREKKMISSLLSSSVFFFLSFFFLSFLLLLQLPPNLVEDGGLAGGIQAEHQDARILLHANGVRQAGPAILRKTVK